MKDEKFSLRDLKVYQDSLRTSGNKGFTLIEMVIVIVILSIISAITLHFLVSSLQIYAMSVNQKTLFDEAKLAMGRMTRDLRDAQSITSPAQGASANSVTFVRTNATAHDSANETITFRLTGSILEKVKTSPSVTSAMANNVTAFTITRGPGNDETKIILTLSVGTGENVTLQSKVYPKNLPYGAGYKNFHGSWKEDLST